MMRIFRLHLASDILRFALPVLAMALMSCSVIEPESEMAPLSVTVSEDIGFNEFFMRCGPGWTGGDSTYSTPLSATRVLWLFSDTFIGPVSSAGKRNPDTAQFVQGNTLVLQDKTSGALTTYLHKSAHKTVGSGKETQSLPTFAASPYDASHCPGDKFIQQHNALAMFQPPQCPSSNHCYYWGGAMVVENKQLYTFLQLMEEKGSGVFDFAWHNSAIATLSVEKIGSAEPVYINVPNNGVSYGGAVITDDDQHTYIYGMREEPAGNTICTGHCLHIALVRKTELATSEAWRYWGALPGNPVHYGWTDKAEDSAPMGGNTGLAAAPKTQDQLGVTRVAPCGTQPACYVMIAHRYTGAASDDILAWYAPQPQGPWSGPVFVYKTPEYTQPGQLFTYNAKIHPAFTNEEGLLVSYDVNSLAPVTDPLSALVTADSYRPRFIRVKLHWGAPVRATGRHVDTIAAERPRSPR